MHDRKSRLRFGRQQSLFLRQARDEGLWLDELRNRQKIEPQTLSRWMRSPKFRRALDEAMSQAARLRDLEIDLASVHAAKKLTELSRGDKHGLHASDQVIRLACVNLIYLAREGPGLHLNNSLKKRRIAVVDHELPRVPANHPDVPPEEAERLRYELDHPDEAPEGQAA
jgi:hypothetical protein